MGQAVPDPTVQHFVQNNKMNVRNKVHFEISIGA